MIDCQPSPELADLQTPVRRFVAELRSPHVAHEFGGLGLSHVGRAVAFEEAGYARLGPVALNVFAPDQGNVPLLEVGLSA